MRFGQQWLIVGKHEWLAVIFVDFHVRDASPQVGYVVGGIICILLVAIDLVAVFQQFMKIEFMSSTVISTNSTSLRE